ncbi:MAG: hypothetical protein CM15mP126_7560 [Gammaproteobacteria bacterium]|nr:MAG: hypothetical protein CM15mP126_7560 [Gammaproteobacteria bacterium]
METINERAKFDVLAVNNDGSTLFGNSMSNSEIFYFFYLSLILSCEKKSVNN